jgi:hypothetical protein
MAIESELHTLVDTNDRTIVKLAATFTSVNPATIANTTILQANTLAHAIANAAYRLTVSEILYDVRTGSNGSAVLLFAGNNAANNRKIMALSGDGHLKLAKEFVPIPNNSPNPTGDIILQTRNMVDGDSVTLILAVKKNADAYSSGKYNGSSPS